SRALLLPRFLALGADSPRTGAEAAEPDDTARLRPLWSARQRRPATIGCWPPDALRTATREDDDDREVVCDAGGGSGAAARAAGPGTQARSPAAAACGSAAAAAGRRALRRAGAAPGPARTVRHARPARRHLGSAAAQHRRPPGSRHRGPHGHRPPAADRALRGARGE